MVQPGKRLGWIGQLPCLYFGFIVSFHNLHDVNGAHAQRGMKYLGREVLQSEGSGQGGSDGSQVWAQRVRLEFHAVQQRKTRPSHGISPSGERIYLKRSPNYLFCIATFAKQKKRDGNGCCNWNLVGVNASSARWKLITPFFRSLELTPGKPETIQPEADLRIVNVSFGDLLKDPSGRTTVKFTYQAPTDIHDDDEQDNEISQASKTAILCSLKPGTVRNQLHTGHFPRRSSDYIQFEQASTDIILQEDEEYTFEVIGQK